ncbi:MAG TPA: autotransporter domain-containing protein [Rhizomicrobium sp.]|nr:autotransporter domain-containing protein [Rhizomicrobium sp.]
MSGSGVVLLGTKTLTVWDSVYKAVRTFSGTISGSGNFVITDATQIFTGTNTYTGGTIVSGILQIGDGGTSGSVVGNITNNALVVFNRSDTVISANVISGSGALTQLGPGSLIFISDNSYTGGTKISGGALQLGNGGTTGTISGDVVDNSALVFNRSNTISFGGAISGTGSVTQAGSGTLILTGSNSYTGGTTISSGTLAVGNGAIAGSITGDVINNGTLMFNRPDSIGFGGVISGTGSVIKTGAGSLTLTGANTYTGTTTIANGTLVIGHAGSGSVAGSITNNAALIFNRSDAVSFANVISGSGTLTKVGGRSLTLSGINTYTGATTVSAGTLNVTGNIAPSAVTVQSGATLGGTGTVGSTIVASGGTLAPGNSIGTLTVSGNLTLASGANYSVEVSPTAADRTMVSGTAGLNGNFIANLSSGTYSIGQRYTVVTAPGGVSGTFASLVMSGPPTYVKGQLSYDANNAYLTLSPNALAPSLSNATGNQGKVVAAIDTSVAAGNIPAGGFVALYGLTGSALNSALDQISGQVGPNTINAVGQGSLSFLTMTAQGGSGTDNFAPGSAYGGADAPHRAQLGAGETRVWASAYGGHVGLSADAASGAASLSSSNVGLIGGADMAWDDGLLAGVTVGLGRQKFSSGNGTGYSDDIMIGVYARKDFGPLYVTAAFGYGSHYIETLRVITVSGTDVLQGKQNADDYGGRVEAGWRTALDEQYMLSPYFAVAAASFETPAYSETALSGASTFALSFAAHSSTLGRTELGSGLSRDYETENGVMTADLRAAWAHQLDDQPFTQASFQTLPGASFLVTGVRPASDTALLGASIQVQNRSGLFFGLKGETQLAAGTTILQGAGHLGWRW